MANIEFGLMLQPKPLDFPGRELFDYNRRLIRALAPGFTTLWAEDHLQLGELATIECLTTLAYFAAEFPAFRVGSLVMSQGYRNPALLAKMAANLQFISGGRLILGLGAGWKEDEYRAYGYPFPDARTRTEELEEASIIIKSMWTSQPATFVGKHYQIHDAYCEPPPSPIIPLLIGGGGEQRTLGIFARQNDSRIQPNRVQPTKKSSMFDLHASILYHRQPSLLGFSGGCVVADAHLQPQYFSSNGDGFFGDGRDILGPAKDIHDLDLFSCLFRLC